jgi:serine/threonine-protein kinase
LTETEILERLRTALADHYRLERELRGGAMSRVFVAEEASLERKVVIKVLPPDVAATMSADRFRREIHLAASLQHPHIVPLLAAGEADGLLYYSMPLVEGESLQARLARDGELPVPEAIRLLRDVADALSYAHRHGVVHRDIKPANILLADGHSLVTDFGVAKALDQSLQSSLTGTGLALGTPAYMAPEQAAADPHTDQRADIYALGILGYEILSGSPPSSRRRHRPWSRRTWPSPRPRLPSCDPACRPRSRR